MKMKEYLRKDGMLSRHCFPWCFSGFFSATSPLPTHSNLFVLLSSERMCEKAHPWILYPQSGKLWYNNRHSFTEDLAAGIHGQICQHKTDSNNHQDQDDGRGDLSESAQRKENYP